VKAIQQSTQGGLLRPLRKLGLAFASRWPWPVSVQLEQGHSMYVDMRSGIGRALFMKGTFDPEVFVPIREVLRPGDTFLDVGANIGYYSVLAAHVVGVTGAVHSFEIDPRPLQSLRRNAALVPDCNLHVNEIAVGDHDGSAQFHRDADSGHSHLTGAGRGVTVNMTTLDEWSRRQPKLGRVTAMKIDIEGAELPALHGARKFLQQHRPLIVCEACDEHQQQGGHSNKELFQFFRDVGYQTQPLANVWTATIVARPQSAA
jgi:FkbM family methyltransferase